MELFAGFGFVLFLTVMQRDISHAERHQSCREMHLSGGSEKKELGLQLFCCWCTEKLHIYLIDFIIINF